MKTIRFTCILLATLCLTSCVMTKLNTSPIIDLPPTTRIGVVPFQNHSGSPQAGQRAAAISGGLMRIKGASIVSYPLSGSCKKLINCPYNVISWQKARAFARANGAQLILTGTVSEWRYKTGLDGEPSVGITLSLVDTKTGRIVWSGVGSQTGSSRSGLSVVAQSLLTKVLAPVMVH